MDPPQQSPSVPQKDKGRQPVTTSIDYSKPLPSRAEQITSLKRSTKDSPFDLLIIGGGATGTGVALDAVTRGLSTALVEREDFSSGTSSRSTKLVHGGVRYLEKAVFCLDYGQLKLVYEALAERLNLLENAPHLTNSLPIMTVTKQPNIPARTLNIRSPHVLHGASEPSADPLRLPLALLPPSLLAPPHLKALLVVVGGRVLLGWDEGMVSKPPSPWHLASPAIHCVHRHASACRCTTWWQLAVSFRRRISVAAEMPFATSPPSQLSTRTANP